MNTRRLARIALLSAMALILFVLEAQIPVLIPVPGLKLGLANLVTLAAMRLLCRKDAAFVLAVRVLLGSFVTGTVSALLYSFTGGICAFTAMALILYPLRRDEQLWIVSIFGAIAHMLGQLAVAVFVTGTPSILTYGFVLMIAAIITGGFNGLCAQLLCRGLQKLFKKN